MGQISQQIFRITTLLCMCFLLTLSLQAQKAISIGKSDFLIEKDEIITDAKRLIGEAEVGIDSLNYARSHETFQQKVAKADPPLTSWTDSDQDLIASVPGPSKDAQNKLADHRASLDRQQQVRQEESDAFAAARRRNNLEQQRLDAIREREQTAAELRKKELDILEERSDRGGYYGYGYGYPVYPIRPGRPVRPLVTPGPTPSYGASGLVPRI